MRPLDRKLVRDLWRLRGQVLTIALVVASGLGGFLASFSTHSSLVMMRDQYYEEGRFAHVFVECTRAPRSLESRIRDIPGVVEVQTQVVGNVLITLPGISAPITGRVVGIPPGRSPQINRVFVQSGSLPGPDDTRGLLVSEGFAKAHDLRPGDPLTVLMNGRFERMTIRGIALSPEFVFAASMASFGDDSRFGVLWMDEERIEAAYDLDGAFNYAALRIARDASVDDILARLDTILEPYGTTGAYGREDQLSHRTLTDELTQQRTFGTVLPMVFLAVAIFLLNVLVGRHILTERSQIASLKAMGYANATIGMHYLKFVLVIVALGILLAIAVGYAFGDAMTGLYARFFHFPQHVYQLQPQLVVVGAAIALAAGVVAVAGAVHGVVRLPPAEAMRPPSPATFRPTLMDRLGFGRLYSPEARMVIRELERRPLRASLTAFGIASSVAIVIAGTCWGDAFDYLVEVEFEQRERPDVIVALAHPRAAEVLHDFTRLPGVLRVEGSREVAARVRHGAAEERISIQGLPDDSELRRVLDKNLRRIPLHPRGIIISQVLAEQLRAQPGDILWVEPLQGGRPEQPLRVSAISGDFMGLTAYMHRRDTAELVGEDNTISTVRLKVDSNRLDELFARLREAPQVAAVGDMVRLIRYFRETSERNLLFFTTILSIFAACIAVGVVYNSVRITLAEHSWELATLRVLGFTRAEVSRMLLGQIGIQGAAAIPLGFLFGYALVVLMVVLIEGEQFRLPVVILPSTYAHGAIVMLVAGILSALIVRARIDRLDLVGVLKTRE